MEAIEQIEQKPKRKGGARPNSGPKLGAKYKKTIAKEAAQMYLIRQVEENIADITAALLDKAKEGDVQGIKEAFDRAWGKVREKHDITILPTPIDEVSQDNGVSPDKEPQ